MAVVLFDNRYRDSLRPFTYNHAIGATRLGIYTLEEWWQKLSGETVYLKTEDYLQVKYPLAPGGYHIYIDAAVLADQPLIHSILQLKEDTILTDDKGVIAAHIHSGMAAQLPHSVPAVHVIQVGEVRRLQYPWQLFMWNQAALQQHFDWLRTRKQDWQMPASVTLTGPKENLLIEEGAVVEHVHINTSNGAVYIANKALVMDGTCIRGPVAICEGAVLKMGARLYGATTIGPGCTIGGEVKNSIFQAFSNKAHDGYIGDSVVGQWCNLGAGTSNSNVKNTGSSVSVWNDETKQPVNVGTKGGVIMGDYTRTAINSSINTGSYFGVCCNVATAGFPPVVLPNFSWLTSDLRKYEFQKALRDVRNWMQMKDQHLSEAEISTLQYIFDRS